MNRRSFIARLLGLPVVAALAPLIGHISPAVDAAVTPAIEVGDHRLISFDGYWTEGTTSGTYTYDFSSVLLENLKACNNRLISRRTGEEYLGIDENVAYWREDMLS